MGGAPDRRQVNGGAVEISRLTATYGRVVAVHDASVTIAAGERVAVVGANGSGKSTLVRCLLGLHRGSAEGQVLVDGVEARTAAEWTTRRLQVAYVPQRPPLGRFPVQVREILASSGDATAAVEAARELGLGDLLTRPIDALSGGQVQRVFLARAIGSVGHGARVVAADEPTSALDFEGQAEVADHLMGLGVTTLVVTHDPSLAARCDRRLEMAGGVLREAP